MITPEKPRRSEARNPQAPAPPQEDSLPRKIEDLVRQERDAVCRRDWSAARVASQERVVLQTARQRAIARRLS